MRWWTQRFLFYIFGLSVLTLGISATIVSRLGTSPFDALNVGLSRVMGLTVGSWEILNGMILILCNALIIRKRPDLPALLTALVTGIGIDFWLYILRPFFVDPAFGQQLFLLVAGVCCIGLGIATYLEANIAPNPVDGFMLAIHQRTGLHRSLAKVAASLVFLFLAFLFQGPIGFGTVFVALAVGPIIGLCTPLIHKGYRGVSLVFRRRAKRYL